MGTLANVVRGFLCAAGLAAGVACSVALDPDELVFTGAGQTIDALEGPDDGTASSGEILTPLVDAKAPETGPSKDSPSLDEATENMALRGSI